MQVVAGNQSLHEEGRTKQEELPHTRWKKRRHKAQKATGSKGGGGRQRRQESKEGGRWQEERSMIRQSRSIQAGGRQNWGKIERDQDPALLHCPPTPRQVSRDGRQGYRHAGREWQAGRVVEGRGQETGRERPW